MTWEDVVRLAKSLPEVEEGASYGTPGLKVRGKFLTRLRPEDDSLVFLEVGFDERDLLIEADPETFHYTAHYKDHPAILARLSRLDDETLRHFLERRWRVVAPKRVVAAYDAAAGAAPSA